MQNEILLKYLSQENIDLLMQFVDKFGIIAGILLPVIETFVPFLPLVAFVSLNVFFFGFGLGYFLSWLGNCLGSLLLFMFIRYIRIKKDLVSIHTQSKYQKLKDRINKNDFTFLFVLLSFPFTPSFVVTSLAAVSDIKIEHFMIALLPSKLIMILTLSFIGYNFYSFWEHPERSIIIIAMILLLNYFGKKMLRLFDEKIELKKPPSENN
jgi:uncharacterized membrane protein YdjX (TVP38/TMEM64 family)